MYCQKSEPLDWELSYTKNIQELYLPELFVFVRFWRSHLMSQPVNGIHKLNIFEEKIKVLKRKFGSVISIQPNQ